MNELLAYTLRRVEQKLRSANLENERLHSPCEESEEIMSINK